MWREGVLTRTPACRAVTREYHLHVLFRGRRTLADIGEGRGGIAGATDVGICHGAGDEEHRPVSGRGKRQATGYRHAVCAALGARRTLAAAVDRDN